MSAIFIYISIFFGSLTKYVSPLKIVDVNLGCRDGNEISAKYLIASKSGLADTTFQVATCKPSYGNYFCQHDDTNWNLQLCKRHEGHRYLHIKCNVKSPFEGMESSYKTFGLKISISNKVHHREIEKVSTVTPIMLCFSANRKIITME